MGVIDIIILSVLSSAVMFFPSFILSAQAKAIKDFNDARYIIDDYNHIYNKIKNQLFMYSEDDHKETLESIKRYQFIYESCFARNYSEFGIISIVVYSIFFGIQTFLIIKSENPILYSIPVICSVLTFIIVNIIVLNLEPLVVKQFGKSYLVKRHLYFDKDGTEITDSDTLEYKIRFVNNYIDDASRLIIYSGDNHSSFIALICGSISVYTFFICYFIL